MANPSDVPPPSSSDDSCTDRLESVVQQQLGGPRGRLGHGAVRQAIVDKLAV